jgi:hypothetical protein
MNINYFRKALKFVINSRIRSGFGYEVWNIESDIENCLRNTIQKINDYKYSFDTRMP